MYSVSFRVYLNTVAGTRLFLNGSASSADGYLPNELINVVDADGHTELAQVVECVPTKRAENDYFWMIV